MMNLGNATRLKGFGFHGRGSDDDVVVAVGWIRQRRQGSHGDEYGDEEGSGDEGGGAAAIRLRWWGDDDGGGPVVFG
nr:hypothetical protein [Tanacetum cinerariifolium]